MLIVPRASPKSWRIRRGLVWTEEKQGNPEFFLSPTGPSSVMYFATLYWSQWYIIYALEKGSRSIDANGDSCEHHLRATARVKINRTSESQSLHVVATPTE